MSETVSSFLMSSESDSISSDDDDNDEESLSLLVLLSFSKSWYSSSSESSFTFPPSSSSTIFSFPSIPSPSVIFVCARPDAYSSSCTNPSDQNFAANLDFGNINAMYSLNFGSSFNFSSNIFSSGDINFSFLALNAAFSILIFSRTPINLFVGSSSFSSPSLSFLLLFSSSLFNRSFALVPSEYFDHARSPKLALSFRLTAKETSIRLVSINVLWKYFCAFMAIVSVLYPINPRHLDADADRECVFTRASASWVFLITQSVTSPRGAKCSLKRASV